MTIGRRRLLQSAALLGAYAPLAGCVPLGRGARRPHDAVALIAAISEKRITASDAIEQSIVRLDRVNPVLNAITTRTYDRARLAARTEPSAPAWGVPTVIKDNAPRAGDRFSQGSRAYRDRIAAETAPYVSAIERAGFIAIARTTCPEFGLAPTTEPQLTGPTRNPWDPSRSVGGSSGGSAALVAARVVHIAHGNDGGGSLRIPASACGVVALKPTRRPEGPEGGTARSRAASGCLSRTVRDTALWLSAVTGVDPILPDARKPLRIGAHLNPPAGGDIDRDVAETFANTIQTLERLGHSVRDTRLPYEGARFVEGFLTLYERNALELVEQFERFAGRSATPLDLEPLTLSLAAAGRQSSADEIERARATVNEQADRYIAAFGDFDVFMSPVLATPPVAIGVFAPTIAYAEQRPHLIEYATYTFIQNAANAPAISLPIGTSNTALPIGIQFAAPPRVESALIALAYEIETATRWFERAPRIIAD